jgi:Tfp pilus assembly protein PilO
MKIENRQKFLLIATLSLLGLVVCNWVIFTPLGNWWTTRSKSITTLRKDLTHGRALIANQANIHRLWEEMQAKTLPNNTSLAEQQVLRAFDDWSRESGATVTGITPQWKNDSTNYMTLNCRVEATGDLGTLSKFVAAIEHNTIALKLDSVELSTHDNLGQQLTLGLQLSGLALTTLK